MVYDCLMKPGLEYRYETRVPGEWVHLRQQKPGAPFIINKESAILRERIEATNGIIYIIDTLLHCPCMEELSNDIPVH